MLEDTLQHMTAVPSSERELGENDIPFLEAEMNRLQRGLTFWEERLTEMEQLRSDRPISR
jgi:hypothetical protein